MACVVSVNKKFSVMMCWSALEYLGTIIISTVQEDFI